MIVGISLEDSRGVYFVLRQPRLQTQKYAVYWSSDTDGLSLHLSICRIYDLHFLNKKTVHYSSSAFHPFIFSALPYV